jgi:hypothetical protein
MLPPEADDELILEGMMVTMDESGRTNIAPMGPRVDRPLSRFVLRPFKSAQTYQNLKTTGLGVFHITDDVLLLAQAAIGPLTTVPLVPIEGFSCPRLADACRWFALGVSAIDDAPDRARVDCRVVQQGEVRPFFGFNRAKHAVLEAAILATRIGILKDAEIFDQLRRLSISIDKTAGAQERAAFEMLQRHIHEHTRQGGA